jgi:hypothetical protein
MIATAAFAVACLRPDVVPATPFVDRVFRTAFSAGWIPGAAVWGGALLLLAPPAVGLLRDPMRREVHGAFGATWLAIIVAAVLGDYPTPLVAYGGSAIVGYLLACVGLPRKPGLSRRSATADRVEPVTGEPPGSSYVVTAP